MASQPEKDQKKNPLREKSPSSSDLGRDARRSLKEKETKIQRSKRICLAYDPSQMDAAVEAIRKKKMSVRAAAEHFNVPAATAARKAKGKNPGAIGTPFVLSETVERDLADMIRSYCSSGNVMEKDFFKEIVLKYAAQIPSSSSNPRKKPFKCSESWIKGFLERNDLKEYNNGKAKPLGIHRRIACNPTYVKEFIEKFTLCFAEYKNHLSEVLQTPLIDLTDEQISSGIFAIDETSISNCTPLRYELKKLTPTSVNCLQADVSGRSTTNASLLEVYCADGTMPFHVMTTKRILTSTEKLHLADIDPRSILFFCDLESGAFNSLAHSRCLDKIGELRGSLPSLVIQDCPKTHRGIESLETARNRGIHLMTLPHHSSWYLQVPDDLPFATLKSRHYREMKNYRKQHNGQSPDLFTTLDIFLQARRDVLTGDIIRKAFLNCGQFPVSARQILLKADRAQQRCGIDIHYKETEELSPVAIQIERAKEKLIASRRELEKIQNLSRRSSGVLEDLVNEQKALEMRRAEAERRDFEERQAFARRQVQAIASVPRPDDPPLFSHKDRMNTFPHTKEVIEYLKIQLNLMKPVIDFLEAQVKESLDSRSGCYMVNPRQTVTPRDLLAVRQDWQRDVRDKIKTIYKCLKKEKELKSQCLEPLCDKKKGKNRGIVCPVCKRGYCPDHSAPSTMQTHINSCLPQTSPVVQFPSVHLSTQLNVIDSSASSSIQITTTVTAAPMISPLRDDINSDLDICSSCQLYISDPTQGCNFCQHRGFGNPTGTSLQLTTTVTTTPTLSPISPLRDDLSSGLDICSICQLYISDPTQGCTFCQHRGFGNISLSLSVSNSPQSPNQGLVVDQDNIHTPLPSSSRSISVHSVAILVTKCSKVCPGCGMSRTLEECSNGHQKCRRCLSDGCHECLGKRRRVAKKK